MKRVRLFYTATWLSKTQIAGIKTASAALTIKPKEITMDTEPETAPKPDVYERAITEAKPAPNPWPLIQRCLYALQEATAGNTQAQAVILRDGQIEIVPVYRLGMGCIVLITATRATLRHGFQITELANLEQAFLQAILHGADPLGTITRLYHDDGSPQTTEPLIP